MADGAGRAKTRVEVCRARWRRVLACGAAAAALVLLLLWAWGVYAFTPPRGLPGDAGPDPLASCVVSVSTPSGGVPGRGSVEAHGAVCVATASGAASPDPLPVRLACGWAGSLPWWALLGLVLGLVLCVLVRFRRLASLPVHPPLWVGAWVACLLVALAVGLSPLDGPWAWARKGMEGTWLPQLQWGWLLLPALWIWGACALWAAARTAASKKDRQVTAPAPDASLPRTPEELMVWLDTDLPITRLEEDRLGHAAIARRMAERLCMDPPASQAVVGPLGSGKSSLGELVKDALREMGKTRVRLVRVELWPYASVEAALRAILERALETLEAEAALPHLKRLPRHYVEGAMAAGGWLAVWASLLDGPRKELLELIRELDDTARALDLRLVLWIEDLERFIGAANRPEPIVLNPEEQRELGPLRALVHAFGSAGNGHVVAVFATTENQLFDLGKVARYIETLEVLRPEQMSGLLQAFLGWVQAEHSGILDVADPRPLGGALNQADDLHEALMEYLCREGRGITTRGAKQDLRLARDFWRRFPGEVDLEDLVVVELLRNNEGWLDAQKQEAEANVDFITLLNKVAPGDDQLMPRWWWLRWGHDEWQKPQAVLPFRCLRREDPMRYWRRVLSEHIEGDADQVRYRKVRDAAQGDDLEALLKMLERPEDGEAVVACAWHLGFEKVLEMWVAWWKRTGAPFHDPHRGDPAGLGPLLRLSKRLRSGRGEEGSAENPWRCDQALKRFLPCLARLARNNPPLAIRLTEDSGVRDLVHAKGAFHLHNLAGILWRALVIGLVKEPDRWAAFLRQARDRELLMKMLDGVNELFSRDDEHSPGFKKISEERARLKPDQWASFWRELMARVQADPETFARPFLVIFPPGKRAVEQTDFHTPPVQLAMAPEWVAWIAERLEARGADAETVRAFRSWIATYAPPLPGAAEGETNAAEGPEGA